MTAPSPQPGWVLDEVTSAGRENLDAEHVARYDDKEDAGAAAEVELLATLGLSPESTIVEFGPGTGQFTLAVAARCRRVVAVDVSPVMLERLQSKLASMSVANVEVVHAGFLSYVHDGSPVHIVYSRLALHHLPDFWKAVALTRIRALLRPGGIVRLVDVVFHFEPAETEARIEAWCATGGTDAAVGWARHELEEHVRDEHSTFTWLLEAIAVRAGFAIETAEYDDEGIFASYVLRAV